MANKLFSTIARLRLLLVMFVALTVSANAWGADYELVTSAPSDWSGEYLIVAGTSALSGGTSSWGTYKTVTVTNDKISTTDNISVTISKGGTSGTYYIYMNSNSLYLKEVTGNTFATADAGSTDTEWKISLNQGNAQIACASATTRYLRLNGTSGYRCYTSATGTLPKLYKKVTAASSYTVTLVPGSGSVTNTELEGASVNLPTPTLDCGDWEFAGWKTTSAVTTETTTEPTLIPAGAYSPTSDITLYAVYQRTENTDGGGGGGVATGTISFVNTTQRDSRTNEQQVWSNEDIIFTNNKSSSTTNVADYSNPARFYANSQIIISAPGAITQIVADCDESKYATALSNSIEDDNTVSGVNITITPSESSNTYTIVSLSAQTRLNSLTVTYTSGGGSSSTTYYHSTPDCSSTEPTVYLIPKCGGDGGGTWLVVIEWFATF